MDKFQDFFQQLYSDEHPTISLDEKEDMLAEADLISDQAKSFGKEDPVTVMNAPISLEELTKTIKTLKTGKAAGEDLIPNEVLKLLDRNHAVTLLNVFNACFENGYYPWTNSIITPLHKKGSRANPDNYRAVAVSSAIGKLLSTILLERLTEFRSKTCPDPPNQLGFRRGCQTNDHVFTLMTLVQKYRKLKKPLYAVFVDYRKAFDSVPRQALFLKLAKLGITGKFYDILRSMYSASMGQIKLSGHVSKRFTIRKGTEQGHPLSPELFKIFLYELTAILNRAANQEAGETPTLRNLKVSHLLFADDLILLSLSRKSTQAQLRILCKYCKTWGLEINQAKTKLLIFERQNKHETSEEPFELEEGVYLEEAQSYCYLGIKVTSNGDFNIAAREDLHLKAVRAMYSLRRTIRKDKLSFKACKTLFTALVKPILLYGAPIWTPLARTIRKLITASGSGPTPANANLLRTLATDKAERLFLSHLKWSLGVNKKTQNAATWEDTDSTPLSIDAIDLSLRFLYRIKRMDPASFVNASYHEQKNLGLPWFKSMREILEKDPTYSMNHFDANMILNGQRTPEDTESSQTRHHLPSRHFRIPTLNQQVMETYQSAKRSAIHTSRKMEFYKEIDESPGLPPYLTQVTNYEHRKAMAQLRLSAHCLQIEKGRYIGTPRELRSCPYCKVALGTDIVETESHVLDECDFYETERQKLRNQLMQIQHPDPGITTHISQALLKSSTHSPRTTGLLARFAAAVLAKRSRWEIQEISTSLSHREPSSTARLK